MKPSKMLLSVVAAVATATTAAYAAPAEQQIKITSSQLDTYSFNEQAPATLPSAVEIILTVDTSVLGYLTPGFNEFTNATTDIDITFFDDAGGVLAWDWPLQHSLNVDAGEMSTVQARFGGSFNAFTAGILETNYDGFVFEIVQGEGFNLFADNSGFPVLTEASVEQPGNFMLALSEVAATYPSYQLIFDSGTIAYMSADADGDGITDADDQCAATEVSETVVFDGINSGVTNSVDANGCSIMDRYAACQVPQSDMLFYSGPTQCEMMMGYQLYREGVITYTELRMLRNAL
ncbi:hypothetical protein CWI80_03965 [Pseudidiomarina sediminum]|uniref:Uncharacterized protein n=1 Tax=Pseudidiomarina sediminum TaxID=431675 RepID=A0A432Z9A2_9GAMM|nr:hypothetical protein [Pseudidiomarina sediminum]RUO74506.1 hypothetical protein CWI80_03965 [Pseudidiomarina sediminum]